MLLKLQGVSLKGEDTYWSGQVRVRVRVRLRLREACPHIKHPQSLHPGHFTHRTSPSPAWGGCVFPKGSPGTEVNRFVSGHRRTRGDGSQPGMCPFPPPKNLLIKSIGVSLSFYTT